MTAAITPRAMYFEYHRDVYATQYLLTPVMVHPVSGSIVPASLLYRQISEVNPRRKWKYRFATEPSTDAVTTRDGVIEEIFDLDQLENAITTAAAKLAPQFDLMNVTGWKFIGGVAVEISPTDIKDIYTVSNPVALLSRMLRAREEAGFEASIWPTTPTAPASITL